MTFSLPALSAGQWTMVLGVVGVFAGLSLFSIWDAFRREFKTTGEKLAWIQAAILVPFLGGLAYLFFGRNRGKRIP
ncbi:MAG: PLD nuclease N-terminal domain-containing protein [Desulfovibrionaceae bacterium]